MTVRECYEMFGGNYEDVLGRLLKDDRILKYLRLFLSEQDYGNIAPLLAAENYEDAFRAVHNVKGMALNLALTPLAAKASTLCEAIRHGKPDADITPMVDDLDAAYAQVTACLEQLLG